MMMLYEASLVYRSLFVDGIKTKFSIQDTKIATNFFTLCLKTLFIKHHHTETEKKMFDIHKIAILPRNACNGPNPIQ